MAGLSTYVLANIYQTYEIVAFIYLNSVAITLEITVGSSYYFWESILFYG